MRILLLGLFIGAIMLTPLFLLHTMVMPQMISLERTYQSADETAEQIANANYAGN